MIIVICFFVFLILILWVWFSVILWSMKNGISPMPSSDKAKKKVLSAIPPKTQGTVLELGSGWGNMATQIAKILPHCQVIGYETSPVPYYFSQIWKRIDRVPNLKLIRKDFFEVSLKDASLIYCYLYPGAMERLKVKFDNELKPGTVIITNTFAVPGWEPVQSFQLGDMYHTRIYVYVKTTGNIDALHAKSDHESPLDLTLSRKVKIHKT